MSLVICLPYGNPRALRVSFREYVFASDIRDVALVSGNVLETHFMRGPAYPVVGQPTLVAKDIEIGLVLAERIAPQRRAGVVANRMCCL